MLYSSDDRGIAGPVVPKPTGAERICLRDEAISSLADSNFSQFAVVCGAGRWDISAAKMSNWLTEEGSEFMNAVSSRCAAFVASRREFAWRIVWDR